MIYSLVQTFDDLPHHFGWLNSAELARCSALKNGKRRSDWLLGRWTAKQLVRSVLGAHLRDDQIVALAAPDGSPMLFVEGEPMFSLSICHSHGRAFCALASDGALGADMEYVEPRVAGFAEDYFTPAEQMLAQRAPQRDVLITAVWSAKEAALKALHLGLAVDTRSVACMIAPGTPLDWTAFAVEIDAGRIGRPASLRGWWRMMDGFVLTLVTDGGQTPVRSKDT